VLEAVFLSIRALLPGASCQCERLCVCRGLSRLDRAAPWGLLLGLLGLACLLPATPALAQGQYINRNNNEVYLPYLLEDGFGTPDTSVNRYLQSDYARRYQLQTFGESRRVRPFFVDFLGYYGDACLSYRFTGSGVCSMPGYPLYYNGALQEATTYEPTLTVTMEMFAGGKITKDLELGTYFTVRAPFIFRDTLPVELKGRLMLSRRVFAGLMPIDVGFLVGPDIRNVGSGVPGATLGVFGLINQSSTSTTRLTIQNSWWFNQEPFQSDAHLKIGQTLSFLKRRLTLNLGGEAVLRRVNYSSYGGLFNEAPPQLNYPDLVLTAGALYLVNPAFKLGLNGQILPYHTPDRNILRWYRPVGPELGLVADYKLAIFDFSLAYTLALVPPLKSPTESLEDTGGPFIPDSTLGQRLAFTLGLRL